MIRDEVKELAALGPMPSSSEATPEVVDKYAGLVLQLQRPLNDEEARLLLNSFGDDDFFGVAWELLHLIETAPHTPFDSPSSDSANEWIRRIWLRGQRTENLGLEERCAKIPPSEGRE